ncbi:uncharacterized protein LOC122156552 isoform X2 [Centrocercus urophasianus]|uniref:uncharacterized protein LOC122156552 isoform X2 n=1 Tax=Centrocercus urophasianus TaxID=9002 RepID=UPI001C64B167|nr:uncharacterized protein LOC122156552 isoform X2 [Centrocercus urophasianus]
MRQLSTEQRMRLLDTALRMRRSLRAARMRRLHAGSTPAPSWTSHCACVSFLTAERMRNSPRCSAHEARPDRTLSRKIHICFSMRVVGHGLVTRGHQKRGKKLNAVPHTGHTGAAQRAENTSLQFRISATWGQCRNSGKDFAAVPHTGHTRAVQRPGKNFVAVPHTGHTGQCRDQEKTSLQFRIPATRGKCRERKTLRCSSAYRPHGGSAETAEKTSLQFRISATRGQRRERKALRCSSAYRPHGGSTDSGENFVAVHHIDHTRAVQRPGKDFAAVPHIGHTRAAERAKNTSSRCTAHVPTWSLHSACASLHAVRHMRRSRSGTAHALVQTHAQSIRSAVRMLQSRCSSTCRPHGGSPESGKHFVAVPHIGHRRAAQSAEKLRYSSAYWQHGGSAETAEKTSLQFRISATRGQCRDSGEHFVAVPLIGHTGAVQRPGKNVAVPHIRHTRAVQREVKTSLQFLISATWGQCRDSGKNFVAVSHIGHRRAAQTAEKTSLQFRISATRGQCRDSGKRLRRSFSYRPQEGSRDSGKEFVTLHCACVVGRVRTAHAPISPHCACAHLVTALRVRLTSCGAAHAPLSQRHCACAHPDVRAVVSQRTEHGPVPALHCACVFGRVRTARAPVSPHCGRAQHREWKTLRCSSAYWPQEGSPESGKLRMRSSRRVVASLLFLAPAVLCTARVLCELASEECFSSWDVVFHCHFNSNFFPLFLEHLLSDQISVSTGSFLLVVESVRCWILPRLCNST